MFVLSCMCGRPATIVGLGVENIGGGGIGPISDNGIGGSGNSDNNIWLCIWWWWCWPPSVCGGGVLPGGPRSDAGEIIREKCQCDSMVNNEEFECEMWMVDRTNTYSGRHGSIRYVGKSYYFHLVNLVSLALVSTSDGCSCHLVALKPPGILVRCSATMHYCCHWYRHRRRHTKHQSSLFSVLN